MFQEILKTRDQEKCFLECRNERLLRKNESLNEKCDGLELTNIHLSANVKIVIVMKLMTFRLFFMISFNFR